MAAPHNAPVLSAKNSIINGGNFTSVKGNMTVNHGIRNVNERPGFILLLERITQSAFYDAADRGDPPNCHPRTRTFIINQIMLRITNLIERKKLIIWLYGPAGSGKTAICQKVAETCAEGGSLVASFFFGRLADGRNTLARFIPTIAYQLSRTIPEIQDSLLTKIEEDPTIFSRSLSVQMRVLIIEPLTELTVELPFRPRVVVIDGVDECGPNDQEHKKLLNVLGAAMENFQEIPITFLIGSRPEYEIRTAFNKDLLSSFTTSLVLDNTYNPDADIRIYLCDKFLSIYQDLRPSVATPWPSASDIDILVQKASGQFIFASTVIKFIDSPRSNPVNRLKIVLALCPAGHETPFTQLDALYHFILSSVSDIDKVLQILTWLTLCDNNILNLHLLDEFLGFDVYMALVDMYALISVPTNRDGWLQIHHASLHDFLMDRSRSLDYHINAKQGHIFLCQRWLNRINNYCSSQLFSTFSLAKPLEIFIYHCRSLPHGGLLCDVLSSMNLQVILEKICSADDLYSPAWFDFLANVFWQAGEATFMRLQTELDTFILDQISRYPAKIQACIAMIFDQRYELHEIEELIHIVLLGITESEAEFQRLRQIDQTYLHIMNHSIAGSEVQDFTQACTNVVKSQTRGGRHFLRKQYYVALAKQVIKAICPLPTEDYQLYYQVRIRGIDNTRFNYVNNYPANNWLKGFQVSWFVYVLEDAPPNLEFAVFLQERALQYTDGVPVPLLGCGDKLTYQDVARISLKYIQRCNVAIPLRHTHLPDTTDCIICSRFQSEAVVIDVPLNEDESGNNRSNSQPHPPPKMTLAPSSNLTIAPEEAEINRKKRPHNATGPPPKKAKMQG